MQVTIVNFVFLNFKFIICLNYSIFMKFGIKKKLIIFNNLSFILSTQQNMYSYFFFILLV